MFACYCAVPKSSSNGIGTDKEFVLRTLNYEYKGPINAEAPEHVC